MNINEVTERSKVFQVFNNEPKFTAVILKENTKFLIKAGGNINPEYLHCNPKTMITYIRKMTKLVGKELKIMDNVICDSLEEAAKCVCFSEDWQKVTYPDFDNRCVYDITNDIKQLEFIEKAPVEDAELTTEEETVETEEPCDSPEENMGAHSKDESETLDIVETFSNLGKCLANMINQPKKMTVELGESSMQRIEQLAQKDSAKDNIDDEDFDWGPDDTTIDQGGIIGVNFKDIDRIIQSEHRALIIEGVPGTGKTLAMMGYLDYKRKSGIPDKNIQVVSFNQEYTYQEFIGGYVCKNGIFNYEDGVFTKLCKNAKDNPDQEFYLGIDELSRGNTEAILGEAMTGICMRGKLINISNNKKLKVPKNIFIIATMNITDSSTKEIDIATYQRFSRLRLDPVWNESYMEKISNGNAEVLDILNKVSSIMNNINETIKNDKTLGKDCVIGVRDIAIEDPTLEDIKRAIRNNLIKTIYRVTNLCYGATKDKLDNLTKNIEECINGQNDKA